VTPTSEAPRELVDLEFVSLVVLVLIVIIIIRLLR